jgi:RHS repeat-associated protein
VSESDVNNNQRTTPFTVNAAAQLPDFVVSALSVSPTSGVAGSSVTVNVTVKNQGAGAGASGTPCRIRLASSTTITSSDPLLDEFSVGSLAAGASLSYTRTVAIPAGTAAGSRYIGATANASGPVSESDVNNNQRTTPFTVTAGKTDLAVVGALTVSPNPIVSGNTLNVGVTIKNNGPGNAPPSTTRIQIKNTALTSTIADQTVSTPAITANQTITLPVSITIPSGTAAGSYNAYAVLDTTSAANQSPGSTGNDYGSSNVFTVSAPAGSAGLSGFVKDQQSNQALGDVLVTLGSYTQRTSSSGYYSFRGIAPGSYTLSINHSGYAAFSQGGLGVSGSQSKDISLVPNFTSTPTSSLSGYLREKDSGAPLTRKTVSLGNGRTATTDDTGFYNFPSFPSGSYTVGVSVTGYLPYNVTRSYSGAASQNIELTKNQTVLGINTQSGYSEDPVNTATGNYVDAKVDLKLPGPGLPFVFERNYNSQDPVDGPLGFGWNHNFNLSISSDISNNLTIRWGDGRTETYNPDGAGGFTPVAGYGVFDKLTALPGFKYSILKKDQTVYLFNSLNRLESITDKNGNTILLTYTGSNLTRITDPVGRQINLFYDAANRIVRITDPINRSVQYGYSAAGDLIAIVDPNGGVTRQTYDLNHQVLTVVDPRGNTLVRNAYDASRRVVTAQKDAKLGQTVYVYDEVNRKTTVTQPLGRVTVDYYDTFRRLTKQTDALGNSTLYAYDDATGNRISVTDKNGKTTTYAYDAVGNVISKTDPLGTTTSITYDDKNNPTARLDELGNTTRFEYDPKGNLNKTTDAAAGVSSITYNTRGQPLTVTDPMLNTTRMTYDPQGNLVTVTDALSKATTFTFDGVGRRLTTKDALNRVTTVVYDNNDNILSVTDPALKKSSFTYDANNNKLTATDQLGRTTSFTYDVKNLLTKVIAPLGATVASTYDGLDQKLTSTDARGNVTRFAYDTVGNLISTTDALGNVTTFTYDPNGNRIGVKNPLQNTTTFTYDALNRLVQVSDPLTNITQTAYDALGRRTNVTDAKGRATTFAYDPLGRLTQVTDAGGGTVKYTYDAAGNRKTMVDPNNHTTFYTYDALNRLVQTTDPSSGVARLTYDAVGNVATSVDPNAKTITYTYDALNRRIGVAYPTGTPVTLTYDAVGNRIGMADSLGSSTFVYDELNRLTSSTDAYGQTVGYRYDANGNRSSLIYPGGKSVAYTYDALNRMSSVTDWLGRKTAYTYDANGNLKQSANPNGTKATYTYDTADRLTALANAKSDASVISTYAFTLDPVGNHSQVNQNEPLAPAVTAQTVNYGYDADNRLTTVGATSPSYDANGNLKTRGSDTFGYDFENRLVQSTISGVASTYLYDGLGNRKSLTAAGATKRFVLDTSGSLSHVLAETDSNGKVTAYYIHGRGLVSRLAVNGTPLYYHFDVRGSTIALSSEAGQLTDQYAYEPFGKLANSQGTTANPFKYVGKYGVVDEGNGISYIRARYYSPELGRFITKDPLTGTEGDSQSLHRYVYAVNNPMRMVDVSGFSARDAALFQGFRGTTDLQNAALIGERERQERFRRGQIAGYLAESEAYLQESEAWYRLADWLQVSKYTINIGEGYFTGNPWKVGTGIGGVSATFLQMTGNKEVGEALQLSSDIVDVAADIFRGFKGLGDNWKASQTLRPAISQTGIIPKNLQMLDAQSPVGQLYFDLLEPTVSKGFEEIGKGIGSVMSWTF